jgi:chromosome segregation ATPase
MFAAALEQIQKNIQTSFEQLVATSMFGGIIPIKGLVSLHRPDAEIANLSRKVDAIKTGFNSDDPEDLEVWLAKAIANLNTKIDALPEHISKETVDQTTALGKSITQMTAKLVEIADQMLKVPEACAEARRTNMIEKTLEKTNKLKRLESKLETMATRITEIDTKTSERLHVLEEKVQSLTNDMDSMKPNLAEHRAENPSTLDQDFALLRNSLDNIYRTVERGDTVKE